MGLYSPALVPFMGSYSPAYKQQIIAHMNESKSTEWGLNWLNTKEGICLICSLQKENCRTGNVAKYRTEEVPTLWSKNMPCDA
jgi:Uri superfamily endonuclease